MHYYLGTTTNGAIVKRASTRGDFAFAAVYGVPTSGCVVPLSATTWSTSREQLSRNSTYRRYANVGAAIEVIPVKLVGGAEMAKAVREADYEKVVKAREPTATLVAIERRFASFGTTRIVRFWQVEAEGRVLSPRCYSKVSAWRDAALELKP